MGKYNFDEIINRKNTNSLKYDYAIRRGKPADILPLWVADMDFRTAPEIIEVLKEKSEHGIFGYSEPLDSYFEALNNWIIKHYHWNPKSNKFVLVPSIVYGICNIIRALTKEGDSIIINQPVYYPFSESIIDNKRNLVVSNLIYADGKYYIDYEDFENKIVDNNVKLYILCNPHNPVGRVWTRDELIKINEIVKRHNVIVISDEIHADFIYPGYEFNSYANVDDLSNAIICTAASKTFNLAGLHTGNLYVENDSLRRRIRHEIAASGYSQSNIMGIISCEAAYRYGEDWYQELLKYLNENLKYSKEYIKNNLPGVKLIEPEGTYLIWLDFNGLNIEDNKLNDIIVNKAKLWLDAGNIFGKAGLGFERINIACPRKILEEAFNRLKKALKDENII